VGLIIAVAFIGLFFMPPASVPIAGGRSHPVSHRNRPGEWTRPLTQTEGRRESIGIVLTRCARATVRGQDLASGGRLRRSRKRVRPTRVEDAVFREAKDAVVVGCERHDPRESLNLYRLNSIASLGGAEHTWATLSEATHRAR
jgi:hypothetical protein